LHDKILEIPEKENIVDYLITEERKYLLFKNLSADGRFKTLANSLPYSPYLDKYVP